MKPKKNKHRKCESSVLLDKENGCAENTVPSAGESLFDEEFDMDFTAGSDIAAKKKSKSIRSVINVKNFILLICVSVFAVCAVILFMRWFDYKRTDDIYLTLSEALFKDVADTPSVINTSAPMLPEASINDYNTTLSLGESKGEIAQSNATVSDINYARIKAKLEELRAVNDDIIGWIKVEGTEINYPFVVGEDNDYYLTHAYNGEYLRSGTIFADWRCSSESVSKNRNTVLYGHNMANGAMFAGVKKFLKEDFFNEAQIYLYTLDGTYVYEPFAMLDTHSSFFYFQVKFSGDSEYEAFLKLMLDNAKLKKDVTLTAQDKILSLSTCSNRTVTGRYCLQARLIRIENQQ
ncbi:MAG: class B sortase [Clostridia bacterium]|nr:class B sortase [Clostridia bacterium]